MKLSEVLKDLKSAEKYCKTNKIKPTQVIVVWDEETKNPKKKKKPKKNKPDDNFDPYIPWG